MEVLRADRRPAPRALLGIAAAGAVLIALSIALIDQPLARWLAQWEPNPIWNRGIAGFQAALGLTIWPLLSAVVVVVVMLATVLVPRWRGFAPTWMFVAGCHLVVRLATRYLKDGTGRLRPKQWLEHGGDTFWHDGGISFPSGDVSIIAGLAIPVILLWPRSRPVAAVMLAVMAFTMVARVAVNDHFVSDAIGGVTLAAVVAWAMGYAVRPFRR